MTRTREGIENCLDGITTSYCGKLNNVSTQNSDDYPFREEDLAQKAQDKCQKIINSIDQGFFLIDVIFDDNDKPIDMYYREANEAATKMLGSDYTGKRLREIDPNYEEYWYEIFGKVALTGESARMEKYAEPNKRWYSFHLFKVGDEKSRRIGNMFLDITDRKILEEALKESEEKYRTLFNSMTEGFCIIEEVDTNPGELSNYRYILANPAFEKITGLKGLVGKTILELVPNAARSSMQIYDGVLKTGEAVRFEAYTAFNIWVAQYVFKVDHPSNKRLGFLIRDVTEMKKAEERLRESEQMYRTLFNNTEDGFVLVEPIFAENGESDDYRMLAVNDTWEQQTGLKAADFAGKRIREAMPDVEHAWPSKFAEVARSGISQHLESYNADSSRWYDLHAFLYREGQVGVLFRDITEYKQAEQALQESEERQRFLLRLSDTLRPLSNSISIQDAAKDLLIENLKVSQASYSEHTEDSIVIKNEKLKDAKQKLAVTGTHKTRDFSGCTTILREGQNLIISDVLTFPEYSEEERANLTALNIMASISVPLIKEGRLVAVLSVRQSTPRAWTPFEISLVEETAERTWEAVERARAEEEVRKTRDHLEETVAARTEALSLEKQRLFNVLETLPACICLLSPDYEIMFSNRAFRDRFGESKGRLCYDYIFGRHKPCESCQSLRPLETGQPIHWTFNTPDGSTIDAYDFPFTDANGKSMVLEMCYDVTNERKVQAEMARLDRLNLIGEMAASIGHEIRNPMTSVRGFLQILSSNDKYREELDFFDLMIEELDRANGIITEFLNMAGDKVVDLKPLILERVINALLPMIMSDANHREIDVNLKLDNTTEVMIDANEMRQLILNMCRNAIDAMSTRGTLTIGTIQATDMVTLFIKDEGSGLCPDIIDRLGTPFVTTKANGTGLGLAVCYSIAARHGARIDYETSPNGTTFYVRIPLAGVHLLPEMDAGPDIY